MNQDEYHEVLRHFLSLVRKNDPLGFDRLMEHVRLDVERPRRALLNAIATYAEFGSVRTVGAHSHILDRLNHYVEPEEGGPIRGIRVALSRAEQRLYETEYVDLVPTLDFGKFLRALHELYQTISEQGDDHHDQR